MRRVDAAILGTLGAIVCCIALPRLIRSGLAIALIAGGISLPVVALTIGALWLRDPHKR